MRLKDIRRYNLSLLVKELGSIAAVADQCGPSEKYLSQILNQTRQGRTPRSMGDAVAEKLERGCHKPEGWMDHDHQLPAGGESPAKPLIERMLSMQWDERRLVMLSGFLDLLETPTAPPMPPTSPLQRATIGRTGLKRPPKKLT